MYTDVPTNGDIAGLVALLLILIAGLIFINHHAGSYNSVDDLGARTRNYDRLQRRQK